MTAKALPSSGVFVISVLSGTRGFCGTCVTDGILLLTRASRPLSFEHLSWRKATPYWSDVSRQRADRRAVIAECLCANRKRDVSSRRTEIFSLLRLDAGLSRHANPFFDIGVHEPRKLLG